MSIRQSHLWIIIFAVRCIDAIGGSGYLHAMEHADQKSFTMRTDGPDGREFLQILDVLRELQRPHLSRTDMLKKLVFDAGKVLRVAKERGKK